MGDGESMMGLVVVCVCQGVGGGVVWLISVSAFVRQQGRGEDVISHCTQCSSSCFHSLRVIVAL